jgi:hypothetical protein
MRLRPKSGRLGFLNVTKKQENVQQQNEATRNEIRRCALLFKNRPDNFWWLSAELTHRGLGPEAGILVDFGHTPDDWYGGCWLSRDRRFYRFEILIDASDRPPKPKVEQWFDATEETEVTAHRRGTGKSFGFIAPIETIRRATWWADGKLRKFIHERG